jgi:Domain of unknown function DUF11
MRKSVGLGLIILLVALLISPVAACPPPPTIVKECPKEVVCTDCPMTCTITVTFFGGHGSYNGKVVDTLPAGAVYSASSDSGSYADGKVTWNLPVTNAGLTAKVLTVIFTPPVGESINRADAKGIGPGWTTTTSTGRSTFVAEPCDEVPEYPSAFLPATMIIGFLGAVLYIKRTREN